MHRSAVTVFALVVLLVSSGCSVPVRTDQTGATPTAVPGGTHSSTGGGDGATARDGQNPYGKSTLVVAIENDVNASRRFGPLVQQALDYWEANSERYAGYQMNYRLEPDAKNPDIVVVFVDDIEKCGSETGHPAGCAPIITKPGHFDPPERVRVQGGFSDDSTVEVLEHEFGHTLGLNHDDAPPEVMAASSVLTTLPRTDAVDRSYAWETNPLSVFVDLSSVRERDRSEVRRQVDEALAYYERGAQGTVPDNVSFVRTDNRTAADVVIQVDGENPCERERGSCRFVGGLDPDGDGRLETFTRVEVYVVGLEPEAVGWHVARHVGFGLSLDTESEFPPPLKESASYSERRSDWWEAG